MHLRAVLGTLIEWLKKLDHSGSNMMEGMNFGLDMSHFS